MSHNAHEDERLADWVDGRMTAREAEAFEAEMRVRPELAAAAKSYAAFTETLRGTLRVDDEVETAGGGSAGARPGLADRIMAQVAEEPAPVAAPRGTGRGFSPWTGSLLAAAAIVLVFVGLAWIPSDAPETGVNVAGRPHELEGDLTVLDLASGPPSTDAAPEADTLDRLKEEPRRARKGQRGGLIPNDVHAPSAESSAAEVPLGSPRSTSPARPSRKSAGGSRGAPRDEVTQSSKSVESLSEAVRRVEQMDTQEQQERQKVDDLKMEQRLEDPLDREAQKSEPRRLAESLPVVLFDIAAERGKASGAGVSASADWARAATALARSPLQRDWPATLPVPNLRVRRIEASDTEDEDAKDVGLGGGAGGRGAASGSVAPQPPKEADALSYDALAGDQVFELVGDAMQVATYLKRLGVKAATVRHLRVDPLRVKAPAPIVAESAADPQSRSETEAEEAEAQEAETRARQRAGSSSMRVLVVLRKRGR